jgi:hypothetical protein
MVADGRCDDCHSPSGGYNGVISTAGLVGTSVGAKENWLGTDGIMDTDDDGVYAYDSDPNTLRSGKEKWCIGCHDSGTSLAGGVSAPAPDVELFYSTRGGHGRSGADMECLDCHVAQCNDIYTGFTHIDGVDRTYAFGSTADFDPGNSGVAYAKGYRLRYVGTDVPLMIPAKYEETFGSNLATMQSTAFRRCFDTSCHNSLNIFSGSPDNTNFTVRQDAIGDPDIPRDYSCIITLGINEHREHLEQGPTYWDSDWDDTTDWNGTPAGTDSMVTCSSCHNVHGANGALGSTNESMIRDGTLAGRTGYGFSYLVEAPGGYPDVTSTSATQLTSVGAVFRNDLATTLMCGGSECHSSPEPTTATYDATGSGLGTTYLEYYRPWAAPSP